MSTTPLGISASTMVNALGRGRSATLAALLSGETGLKSLPFAGVDFNTYTGQVAGLESYALQGQYSDYDCRNNRLARLTLETDGFVDAVDKARARYGPTRIGLFLGTSTSGEAELEHAYTQREQHGGDLADDFRLMETFNAYSLAAFTRLYLGLEGVSLCILTACSSSAKVFAAASRYIQAGLCDVAVVGGVDSLCLTTLYGFNSLELVASDICRPWDADRKGINIGEAGGFALLEPLQNIDEHSVIRLLGYGESSDAYHMSTPHPQGAGAIMAMRQALSAAGLHATDIDYINLHGTATRSNDSSEDIAVSGLFGRQTACSSTKGWTGHTLGAAGITEALICCLALENNFMPGNLNMNNKDTELVSNVLSESRQHELKYVMSNSFGFGGSNCSLLFGRQT